MSPNLVHRSSRLRTACVAVVAAVGFLAASPRASADTVNLTLDKTALPIQSSSAVGVKVVSGPAAGSYNGIIPGPYYWHESSPPPGSLFPNPTTTFCVELNQQISVGNTISYQTSTVATAPNISAAQATAISELYAGHYDSSTWGKSSFGGSDQSTAFQLALWALVYDSSSNLKLTGSNAGNLQVTSASQTAIDTAQTWLNTLGSQPSFASVFPNSQLVWLTNPNCQDQLTIIPTGGGGTPPPHGVPAPPGVLLGLIGLGGCLLGRGFRRRTATAVAA
ncbi:MAG: hypothetical protein JWO38_1550 [Gemmataceae bacterium]|nr:hypothetical protein [Gemmataceae bacterium]